MNRDPAKNRLESPAAAPARRRWPLQLLAIGLALGAGLLALRGRLPLTGRAADEPGALNLAPLTIDPKDISDAILIEKVQETARRVEASPQDPELWMELGETYLANNIHVRAVTCFDNVIALRPDMARAYHLRAVANINLGYNDRALSDFDEAMTHDAYVPSRWRKGFVYLDLDEPKKALVLFTSVLKDHPKDYAAALGAARAYLALDDPATAVKALNTLIGRDERNDGYLYLLLGTAYQRQGKAGEAQQAMSLSAKGRPLLDDPWLDMIAQRQPGFYQDLQRSYWLLKANQPDQALEILVKLQERDPNNATVLGNIGGAYLTKGELDKAIDYNVRALEITPMWVYGHMNLSKAYFAKAEKATDPEDKAALHAKSREHARSAIASAPSNPDAIAMEASFLAMDGELDRAIARFKDAFESVDSVDRRDHVELLFKAGQLENNAGMWEQSVETLERVVAVDPTHGEAYFRLALSYGVLGQDDKAMAMYQKAKQTADPHNAMLMADIARFEEAMRTGKLPEAEATVAP